MFHNPDYNFLFLASPKTGSETVQLYLSKLSEGKFRRNEFYLKSGQVITMPNHSDVEYLTDHLPGEELDKIKKIVFVRNPYHKAVSAYFYYKQMSVSAIWESSSTVLSWKIIFVCKVLFCKIFPFGMYVLFYPFKSDRKYIESKSGEIFVDFIGRTEYLSSDLARILQKLGMPTSETTLPKVNKSTHNESDHYYNNRLTKWIFERKNGKDIEIYNALISQHF
ncbi:MAG: sulfotransferase family 2 domain-containing protein [Saprospiraceae bacterium]|nr:sulfotransferase family 2 domain-containing protein [Lewinella sp.]